ELAVAGFGGSDTNFRYPRHALDFAFLRVWENDQPHTPEAFFRWSTAGAREGDLAFLIGSPSPTSRNETVDQLLLRRDVTDLAVHEFVRRRVETFSAFANANPSQLR